jgi:ribosomal protein S12 methylthiotransferase accessory factor
VGVVQGLVEFVRATDECRLVSYGATIADGTATVGQHLTGTAGGTHWDRRAARAAALAESLERYASSYLPRERLVLGSFDELDGAVDPESFALFDERQYAVADFPFVRFEGSTVVRWTEGVSLRDGTRALLPAQVVYLPIDTAAQDEELIAYTTSSGVACGQTCDEAILSGLLELVERDAFMLAWYDRLELPLLEWGDDEELDALDRRYFRPSGLRYSAVDLSVFFGIPCVLGVVHGTPGEVGALGVGAACAATIREAWRKALAEAFAVRTHVRDEIVERPESIPATGPEISTFDDHIFFYAEEGRARRAAFLDAAEARRPIRAVVPLPGRNARERIEAAVERLASRGVSAYAVDVATPDVRAAGLHVWRAVAPELCALDVVDRARFLGGARLYRAAHDAGLRPAPLRYEDLNLYPHPFP